jgi:hypothetical protein
VTGKLVPCACLRQFIDSIIIGLHHPHGPESLVFFANSDLYSTGYERLCSASEAWIYMVMIRLMVKRLVSS